jgi:hypothetical protein
MRRIPLRSTGAFDSRTVLAQVAGTSAAKAIGIGEMRRRVRILDALDAAAGEDVLLEDADYDALRAAIGEFPFALAHRDLLRIVDDVLEAGPPSPAA